MAAELAAVRDLETDGEALLLWESRNPCVVLPRSGLAADSVVNGSPLPVLRRASGGGAVVLGPGCLNYALALSLERRPALLDVEDSYRALLGALAERLPVSGVRPLGSDLALGDRKFAGHAQKRSRGALLHHGAILYDFDLALVSQVLREPQRQPHYRRGRTHADFLVNLPLPRAALLECFQQWACRQLSPLSAAS